MQGWSKFPGVDATINFKANQARMVVMSSLPGTVVTINFKFEIMLITRRRWRKQSALLMSSLAQPRDVDDEGHLSKLCWGTELTGGIVWMGVSPSRWATGK